nr:retrotransposon protein, putative, unclassified [Tanacetum cinerariifolium]
MKTQQLGKDFVTNNKACFKCGHFDHLAYDCGVWVNKGNSWLKNNYTQKSRTPRTVFHKTDRTPAAVNRTHMNGAQPKGTYFAKTTHSYVRRPFQRKLAVRTQFRVPRVSTVNTKFPTGNLKLSTADLGNKGKAVKASACWIWRPKQNTTDKGYWDNGCSRHMTGNISYLSDYEPYDEGYVSFGQGGGKITGKGIIKIGTKDVASQDVKKDVFSLRYIALPNWFHEAHLESSISNAQDACNANAPKSNGNFNPTATSKNPLADQMETLIMEFAIPTVSSPVLTACLDNSPEPSSGTRLISKRVTSQDDTPSLDNILTLSNRPIGTKWVLKNKKDERGIVIRNKARQVAQGHTHKEGIDYEEVFAPVARIEAIRLFLAYASFMGFTVYQIDVKSAFLYGIIDEEVYVMQPPGFQDPEFPARVYKEEKAMYGLHQAPRAWYGTLSKYLLTNSFQREEGWHFSLSRQGKDGTGKDVDLHLYRSMIGSLMYLTASRPDIMFAVCAHARHKVTPKECHLHAVKRIFRYLKGHPKLGLWYPKYSPFDLVAYSDSDYGGATQDRKSTTGGCQFLGRRLISWQCKKQTIVATSTTKAEYVAAASGCGQVMWIQNQLLDYGLSFCDFHNMIAILEKYEHNVDFHQIVDLLRPLISGTKILATVDGKSRTISESLIKRNLKLNDEEGISSLPDAELFENLALMRYNILPNQKFTFQKGQFSHKWKYLIHTIMQCLSLKSIGFNEFSSNIATAVGEGSGTPTEPHHTPSPKAQQSPHTAPSSPSSPATTETIPTSTPTEIPTLRQYSRRAKRIAQSIALPTATDEPASLLRDDSQREAFPTVSGLEAGQDRENIIKTSVLPHDSTPRVNFFDADEGNLEISSLKARIKILEDKDKGTAKMSGEDATIKGRSLETGEEAGIEKSTERGSNDTEELVNVLTSIDAATILTSRVQAVSVPPVTEIPNVGVPTGSGLVPTASPIFTTASVVTPYSRRKGKEKMVESDTPKKKNVQEQIEEELQMLIDGLDRNNKVIAKHLQEYEQFAADLSIGEKIDFLNELVKYQDQYVKVLKYQAQQSKPLSKKQQREFYMSVLKSHPGWKTKHFRGMTLEEIREKFIPVWKQIEDFVPMASKEEGERMKRKGLMLEHESAKKMKTSKEVSKEDLKEIMQLVPVEEKIIRLGEHTSVYQLFVDMLKHFDREDLNLLWTLVKETLNIKQASSDKEKELWVELKRLFDPDFKEQLWTHTQALMHDPVEWRLYDTYGSPCVYQRARDFHAS